MPSQREPQRQVHRMSYADPRRNHALRLRKPIVADLQRGRCARHVQPIVQRPRQPECQAKPARPRSDHPQPGRPHPARDCAPSARFPSPAPGPAAKCLPQSLALAADVHAEILSVDEVQIRVPRRPKQHQVSGRRSAMRVRCWIGRIVVRPQIGLDLDDPPGQRLALFGSRATSSLPRSLGATISGEFSKNSREISRPGRLFWPFMLSICAIFSIPSRVPAPLPRGLPGSLSGRYE